MNENGEFEEEKNDKEAASGGGGLKRLGLFKKSSTQKDEPENLFDEYYSSLYSKDGYRLRDIYPEAANKFMLMPDDAFKTRWEIAVSMVLIFTAVCTPYRLAFSESDDLGW